MPRTAIVALLLLGPALVPASAEDAKPAPAASAPPVVHAAQAYVRSLTAAQRTRGVLAFNDPNRRVWTFLPGTRKGLTLRALAPAQRTLARALVDAVLSARGRAKVKGILALEEVLHAGLAPATRRLRPSWRDPLGYTVTVFGAPTAKGRFGFRFGGHHLSLNVVVTNGKARCAPFFFGGSPARVTRGPKRGLAPLADQEDRALALLRTLTAAQRKQAIVARRTPGGIVFGPSRSLADARPAGISLMDLSESQIAAVWQLVDAYDGMLAPDPKHLVGYPAAQSDPRKVFFQWRGPTAAGGDQYYRIQGPRFVIEYWKQGNHIHSVWRDATDFGAGG